MSKQTLSKIPMNERLSNIETKQKGLGNLLKVMALSMATLPAESKAEEIPEIDNLPWHEGVELLQESVKENPLEVAALYLIKEDGTGVWKSVGVASKTNTGLEVNLTRDEALADIADVEAGGEEVISVCAAHSHPIKGSFPESIPLSEIQNLIENGQYFLPPSDGDMLNIADNLHARLIDKPAVSGVFSPGGIWYSRPADSADYLRDPLASEYYQQREDARGELFGSDTEDGVFMAKLGDRDIQELATQLGVQFPSEVDASFADLLYTVERVLLDIDTPTASFLTQLNEMDSEIGELATDITKMKILGNVMQFYSTFYFSRFGHMPEEYDDVIIEHLGMDLNWREAIADYNLVKYEQIGDEAVPIQDNFLSNYRTDALLAGAVTRFVTYEDAAQEPPCAGPDYQPNKQ